MQTRKNAAFRAVNRCGELILSGSAGEILSRLD